MTIATPTRSQIETWRTDHLTDTAAYLTTTAETWEHAFDTAYSHALTPGGSAWFGKTAEAAITRAHGDRLKVIETSDTLLAVAARARAGATEIDTARETALAAIARTLEAGFGVDDDLSVTFESSGNAFADAIREAEAKTHAADIWASAIALANTDAAVANSLTKTAGLGEVPAPASAGPGDTGAVQLVGSRWGTTELPPAPPGKEWHYYWNWGWVLEDPLRDCSNSEKFWDVTKLGVAGITMIFGGPLGVLTGAVGAGEITSDIRQCR